MCGKGSTKVTSMVVADAVTDANQSVVVVASAGQLAGKVGGVLWAAAGAGPSGVASGAGSTNNAAASTTTITADIAARNRWVLIKLASVRSLIGLIPLRSGQSSDSPHTQAHTRRCGGGGQRAGGPRQARSGRPHRATAPKPATSTACCGQSAEGSAPSGSGVHSRSRPAISRLSGP